MSEAHHNETGRMEAFSDAVIAIIMTIMVLELHVPDDMSAGALRPLIPVFLGYVLSFAYLAIYWNNHHHLLHATKVITGGIMWANTHLLFWLSLIPFATAWVGESHGEPAPAAFYGFVLFMNAIAYWFLVQAIIYHQGKHSTLAKSIGRDLKGKLSIILYLLGIGAAFLEPLISYGVFLFVALLWIVPDRRLEPHKHHGHP